MLDRRRFLTGAIAGAALSGPGASVAQTLIPGPTGYASPTGTSPFPPEVFRDRRRRLMEKMDGGIAVLFSAGTFGSTPVGPPARQNSDFAYLTGIQDEGAAALLLAPNERIHKEILFLGPRNPDIERWEGERLPVGQSLRERTGFERVLRASALGGVLATLASQAGVLHFLGPAGNPDGPVPPALELYGRVTARVPGARIVNSLNFIRDMRMVKEPGEIEMIRRAIAATERGLVAGMRAARPGMRENELKRIIEAEFHAAGATGTAFPSIVATGRASAVLHYLGGDGVIQPGDMILCDVGAEVGRYAADITRTFPVDGRFNVEQRRVYETVLAAQEAAMARLRAGAVFEDLHATADRLIREAGHGDDFWHGLGHFIGLDVHDAGSQTVPLPANATLTIEPGIYQPERNFGVRIEDDFLVTPRGYEHLSQASPRRIEDIEALLASR